MASQCYTSGVKAMTQGGGRKVVSVGNYRFTGKRLGKGNFARVDEAVHTVLNVKVGVFHYFSIFSLQQTVFEVTAICECFCQF